MKINFLGDSITEGAGASSVENRYVNLVGAKFGAKVCNYGVGGTRLARQSSLSNVAYYDYDFQPYPNPVDAMIKCEHIFKSFEGRTVLNDISVTFETGKTNLIIGRSGSGKTVLLKTLVNLHEPDSGEIYFDDVCY